MLIRSTSSLPSNNPQPYINVTIAIRRNTLRYCALRLAALEQHIERKLETHDQAIAGLINTLRQMMSPEEPKKRPIGFIHPKDD